MIELFYKTKWLTDKPYRIFILGFFFVFLGTFFSLLIFKSSASFPTIFLTTFAAVPTMNEILKKEKLERKVKNIFTRHFKIAEIYSYLFFGMSFAFAIIYAFMPIDLTSNLFSEQRNIISGGLFLGSTALSRIIINNIGLVVFFFILAIFYGSGSVFLLSWNASILGLTWGNGIKAVLSFLSPVVLASDIFLQSFYLLPEVLAYFFAAIAGGIVSVNILNKKNFDIAFKDALFYLVASVFLILIAGFIEVIILSL